MGRKDTGEGDEDAKKQEYSKAIRSNLLGVIDVVRTERQKETSDERPAAGTNAKPQHHQCTYRGRTPNSGG